MATQNQDHLIPFVTPDHQIPREIDVEEPYAGFKALVGIGFLRPSPGKTMFTLDEARYYVQENLDVGVSCPCCHQYARRYVRKLNAGMAKILIYLVKQGQPPEPEPWIHVKRFVRISREVYQLGWWDLVERRGNTDPTKRDSGYWRATQKGIDFAHGKIRLPESAVVFDGALESYEGDPVTIWDALGSLFDYHELMNAVPARPEREPVTASI